MLELRIDRLERRMGSAAIEDEAEFEETVKEESEEEAEQVVETTSMLETITVSAVAIIVGALAFRFLSLNQAKRIADRVRDFFFSGRSS